MKFRFLMQHPIFDIALKHSTIAVTFYRLNLSYARLAEFQQSYNLGFY